VLSAAGRRPKESFPAAVDLAPVRLVGGFVCVDSHLGCAGCHFCLNRRYPGPREVLDRRVHREWAEAGLPPRRIAELVARLPAVTHGGVPVRFGHLSDLRFELDGAEALLAALPPRHPAMLLTRFPPEPAAARLLAAHGNALLNVSITPPVAGAISTDVRAEAVVAALGAVPGAQLFVTLGPLVDGSEEQVRRLLPSLPRGAAVGFRPLAAEGLPFRLPVPPLAPAPVRALEDEARALGLDVPPMAGCRLRANLGIPFFRRPELVADDPRACDGCRNRSVCTGVAAPADDAVRGKAALLGLRVDAIHRTARGIAAETSAPVARADEAFLSEALAWPVFLSGVGRGSAFRVVERGDEVLRRWERTGFFPVGELAAAVAGMKALCGLGPATRPGGGPR
jgi:hypothetical protein